MTPRKVKRIVINTETPKYLNSVTLANTAWNTANYIGTVTTGDLYHKNYPAIGGASFPPGVIFNLTSNTIAGNTGSLLVTPAPYTVDSATTQGGMRSDRINVKSARYNFTFSKFAPNTGVPPATVTNTNILTGIRFILFTPKGIGTAVTAGEPAYGPTGQVATIGLPQYWWSNINPIFFQNWKLKKDWKMYFPSTQKGSSDGSTLQQSQVTALSTMKLQLSCKFNEEWTYTAALGEGAIPAQLPFYKRKHLYAMPMYDSGNFDTTTTVANYCSFVVNCETFLYFRDA